MSAYNLPERQTHLLPRFVTELPADGRGKLAIFDADGTLWRGDVADDFACWMIERGHVDTGHRWDEYLRIYREDHGEGCRFMLSFYAGLDQSGLQEHVARWWREESYRMWIPEVLESLYWLSNHSYSVWIVTGSPTDTMLPLLDLLPVDRVVGLDFELQAGVITGRLSGISCTDEGKAEKVRQLWGDAPILFAAGNGSLDAAMMRLSTGVIWSVYPNSQFLERSRAEGWHVLPRPGDFVEESKLS